MPNQFNTLPELKHQNTNQRQQANSKRTRRYRFKPRIKFKQNLTPQSFSNKQKQKHRQNTNNSKTVTNASLPEYIHSERSTASHRPNEYNYVHSTYFSANNGSDDKQYSNQQHEQTAGYGSQRLSASMLANINKQAKPNPSHSRTTAIPCKIISNKATTTHQQNTANPVNYLTMRFHQLEQLCSGQFYTSNSNQNIYASTHHQNAYPSQTASTQLIYNYLSWLQSLTIDHMIPFMAQTYFDYNRGTIWHGLFGNPNIDNITLCQFIKHTFASLDQIKNISCQQQLVTIFMDSLETANNQGETCWHLAIRYRQAHIAQQLTNFYELQNSLYRLNRLLEQEAEPLNLLKELINAHQQDTLIESLVNNISPAIVTQKLLIAPIIFHDQTSLSKTLTQLNQRHFKLNSQFQTIQLLSNLLVNNTKTQKLLPILNQFLHLSNERHTLTHQYFIQGLSYILRIARQQGSDLVNNFYNGYVHMHPQDLLKTSIDTYLTAEMQQIMSAQPSHEQSTTPPQNIDIESLLNYIIFTDDKSTAHCLEQTDEPQHQLSNPTSHFNF